MTDIGSRAGVGKALPLHGGQICFSSRSRPRMGVPARRDERTSAWSQLANPERTLGSAVPRRVLDRYFGGRTHHRTVQIPR